MDIERMKGSTDFILEWEEVKKLVEGSFRSRKCITCDGTGWIHHKNGEVAGTGYCHDWSSEDADDWITPESCEECCGFGQIITFI